MIAPRPRLRDYAMAAIGYVLMFSWVMAMIKGLVLLVANQNIQPLVLAMAATFGYFICMEQLMKRSQYVTYLWLRRVGRKEFEKA